MKAIRHPTDMVEVREEGKENLFFNLHCGFHCDELQRKVGKLVFDLLIINKNKLINCQTLEVEE